MSFINRNHLRRLSKAANTMADRVGTTGQFTGYLGRNDGTNTIINADFPAGSRMVWYYESHSDQPMLYGSAILREDSGIPFANIADNKDLPVRLGRPPGDSQVYVLGPLYLEGLSKFSGQTPTERWIGSGTGGTVTSVGLAGPTGTTITGSPVTTAGTLAMAWTDERDIFPTQAIMRHDLALVVTGNAFSTAHDAAQNYGLYAYQTAAANGDKFSNRFRLKSGSYYFLVEGYAGPGCAKIDWALNGAAAFLSGQDWYAASNTYNVRKVQSVSIASTGYFALTGLVNGRNAGNTTDWLMRLTWYAFIPTSD